MQLKPTIVILYSDYNSVSIVMLVELFMLVYITFSRQMVLVLVKLC